MLSLSDLWTFLRLNQLKKTQHIKVSRVNSLSFFFSRKVIRLNIAKAIDELLKMNYTTVIQLNVLIPLSISLSPYLSLLSQNWNSFCQVEVDCDWQISSIKSCVWRSCKYLQCMCCCCCCCCVLLCGNYHNTPITFRKDNTLTGASSN